MDVSALHALTTIVREVEQGHGQHLIAVYALHDQLQLHAGDGQAFAAVALVVTPIDTDGGT